MGYTNITNIQARIAQALTTGSPSNLNTPVDLLSVGNTLDSNLIPDDVVEQYILWADNEIDAALNQLYLTPFCEKGDFETCLFAHIDEYNDFILTEESCGLNIGDNILLIHYDENINQNIEERHIINDIVDQNSRNIFSTLEPIGYNFPSGSRIVRVKYPDPITFISTSKAAAYIYDKYFMSQSDANESEYGKYLRKQADQHLNNILEGRTILHGVKRRGRRLYNPNITDQYSLPEGSAGARSLDNLN